MQAAVTSYMLHWSVTLMLKLTNKVIRQMESVSLTLKANVTLILTLKCYYNVIYYIPNISLTFQINTVLT